MKLEFYGKCKTKQDEGLYLNIIIIKRTDGKLVTIDRDTTYVHVDTDNNVVSVTFVSPYEWDGDDKHYLEDNNIDLYDDAELIGYETEDDAPSNYDVEFKIGQKIVAW